MCFGPCGWPLTQDVLRVCPYVPAPVYSPWFCCVAPCGWIVCDFFFVMFCWFVFYGAGVEVDGKGDGFLWGTWIVFFGLGFVRIVSVG